MTMVFGELDARLSTIKRWSIVPTIQEQTVAAHCFNVERICTRIAPLFGINGLAEMCMLSQAALHHDDKESLIGDIPSTAKSYITIAEIEIDTVGSAWYDHADVRYKEIVKLADMMEMFHFLSIECLMGNRYVSVHKNEMRVIIRNYIRKRPHWDADVFVKVNEWMAFTERTLSESFRRGEHAVTESSAESTQGG
jgi:hypothetical protein